MEVAQVKHKSEGVKHCCYGTCNSDTRYRHRDDMNGVFFIPFPKPITQREKCERWIKACGRPKKDFNVDKIKRCTYMCSKHFVGCKGPTELHPDPLPALLHNEEQIDRFKRKRKAPTPRKQHIKILRKDVTAAAESLLELSEYTVSGPSFDKNCTESMTSTPAQCETNQEKSVQTESVIQHNKEVQTVYGKEILNAKIENMVLKNKMRVEQNQENKNASSDAMLSLESLKSDDVRMKLFTGLQYNQFMTLFEFLGESVHKLTYWDGKNIRENAKKGNRKLEPKEELFLTLVRLKRGFNLDVMSHFFRLSSSTVSVVFTTWIQFLYCHFNDYRNIMFPERQHFKEYMPRVFRCFKNI
ncbi:unnamed protein product [Mytilus coruscus]|uniref:THAP-type domain-containing protein n=1 Tax=Mytilus coruscus TaxID=42192 RepID=A0A6J8DC93_MYTCO|nr:unnamed protein product [Mytilus coruscus]